MRDRLTVILGAAVVYAAAYVALLAPRRHGIGNAEGDYISHSVAYRIPGWPVEVLFRPAHKVDAWLRPSYWSGRFFPSDEPLQIPL